MHRRALNPCVATFAAVVWQTAVVHAQTLFERTIAGNACYARTYDAAHLKSHARQTVTHFFLRHAEPDPMLSSNPAQFSVTFGFRVKGSSDLFEAMGVCRSSARGAECGVEGDGGSFTLAPDGTGLRVTIARMEVEGSKSFSRDLAKGDNRVILLRSSPDAACVAK